MPKSPKFEGGGLSEGEGPGRFRSAQEIRADEIITELSPKKHERVDLKEAREIMGDDFFGSEEIQTVFGWVPEHIPAIPFPADVLQNAKRQNFQLVYFVDQLPGPAVGSSIPFTIANLEHAITTSREGRVIWPGTVWSNQNFMENETPRAGWRLVAKDAMNKAGSEYLAEGYFKQIDTIFLCAHNLYHETEKGMPEGYRWAIGEYEKDREEISRMLSISPSDAARTLLNHPVSDYFCESAVEAVYRAVLSNQLGRSQLPIDFALWTKSHQTGDAPAFGSGVRANLFGKKICVEIIEGGRIGYRTVSINEATHRAGVIASFRGN